MAINLSDNILSKTTAPGDAKYGPYSGVSLSAALDSANAYLLPSYRYKGLTIGIIVNSDPIVEYWFSSGIEDIDLTIKETQLSYNTDFTTVDGDLSIQLDATTIVQPTIASTWSIYKTDGTTPFTSTNISGSTISSTMPRSGFNSSIIVPTGAKVSYSGAATIPTKTTGQGYQTSVTGDYIFSPTPPIANATSTTLTASNLNTTTSYTIGLSKLKTGLIVVNSQVVRATGNDTSSATHAVYFDDVFYYGYLFIGPALAPITQGTVDGIIASQIQGLGNYRFGTKSQTFAVNDGVGGAGGAGWRVVFAYLYTAGNISELTVTGSSINQSDAFTKRTSDLTITTIAGISAIYRVYVANASAAYNTTITIK